MFAQAFSLDDVVYSDPGAMSGTAIEDLRDEVSRRVLVVAALSIGETSRLSRTAKTTSWTVRKN